MPRPRIKIVPHLDHAELTRRYETCSHPVVKNYWLTIQLLSNPESPLPAEQVAQRMECSVDWVRKLAGRYNRLGPNAIANSRSAKPRERVSFS
jgi:hypothetical protein